MSAVHGVRPPVPEAARGAEDARLKKAAQQMEGVFVQQLFKAMRETVPDGELARGGMGEEIFTGLLDQQVAESAALGWERGLGASLYRQLRAQMHVPTAEETGAR